MTTKRAAWIAGGAAAFGLGYYFYKRRRGKVASSAANPPAAFEVTEIPRDFDDNIITFPAASR